MPGTVTICALSATIVAPRKLRVQELPIPQPQDHELRVKLEGCGVCASNLPLWEGRPWFEYPREPGSPGHEGWGRVDAVGAAVNGYRVGDRVALVSYHAFAGYELADAGAVMQLPAALAGRPFPAEPLGCAMNVFGRSDVRRGDTVAIVGVGFLGALLTQLAATAGARVIGITRRAFALEMARQLGAHETIQWDDNGHVVRQVLALTNNRGCERVIECAGTQSSLDLASELVRERGMLVVAGYHQDGLRQVNMQSWNWRGIDVINAHERDPEVYRLGMQLAVDAVVSGTLDPAPLYTHNFRLHELPEAFELIRERPDGFMKALVLM